MGLKLLIMAILIYAVFTYDITEKEIPENQTVHPFRHSKLPKRITRMLSGLPTKRRKMDPSIELLISEVNFDSPKLIQKKFVEVEIVRKKTTGRPKSNILEGFFLLFITSNPLQIVISVNLGDRKISIDPFTNFIVVGTSQVENVDYDIRSEKMNNVYKTADDAFPNADIGPVGIILAFQPYKEEYRELLLFKSPQGAFLPTDLVNNVKKRSLIKSLVKDMVVVGRKAPYSHCEFFDSLNPVENPPYTKYILRDWDSVNSDSDISLNRCSENKNPFQMESFKPGPISPGKVNYCSASQFVLEREISTVAGASTSSASVTPVSGCYADFPNVPVSRYQTISEDNFQSILKKYFQSPFNSCPIKEIPSNSPVTVSPPEGTTSNPFEITHVFKQEWQTQCSSYLPRQGVVLGYSQIKTWIDVLVKDTECRFSCAACKRFFADGFRVDFKYKSDIQTEKGYYSTNPSKNQEHIISHNNNDMHIRALEYFLALKGSQTQESALIEMKKQELIDIEIFRSTSLVMQFVYTEIMADVSFNKHPVFMSALLKMGLNVGNVQHSSRASREMMAVFSQGFHRRLLQFLVAKNPYFTLILDASTFRNIPYLVVLMQTTENNNPRVFFYCLIPLDSEKGSVMLKHLQDRIFSDDKLQPGFEKFFRERIIAQSSDSASAMVGSQNSFYTHLRDYINRDIALVRCSSHRTELAIKHAMKITTGKTVDGRDNKYFLTFGTVNNELYTFYYSRGSKRFIHLLELAEELGFTPVRLKYFFDIRWAASHRAAMLALHSDYQLIKADLGLISTSTDFDENARNKASSLKSKISDKAFFPSLCEMLDILSIFSTMSLSFQVQDGLMISKAEVVRQGIKDIAALKITPGKYLQNYLKECECPNICHKGECTLSSHDNCPNLMWGNTVILTEGDNSIKLSEYRNSLYDALDSEMKRYFPLELLESFNLFSPKYFKAQCHADCSTLSNCYNFNTNAEITDPILMFDNVCKFYHFQNQDCSKIKSEWVLFLGHVVSNKFLMEFAFDDPSKFWPLALSQNNLMWTTFTTKIIQYILSTGFSSSSAEFSFSIVKSIQEKERASLTSENLEMISRIKINGPKDFTKIDIIGYTKDFLKNHYRVDEDANVGGRPPNPEKFKNFFEKSDIF